VLCIQGFLAARKHAEQILLLAEMMQVTQLTSAAQVTFTCTDVRLHAGAGLERAVFPRRRKSAAAVAQALSSGFHRGAVRRAGADAYRRQVRAYNMFSHDSCVACARLLLKHSLVCSLDAWCTRQYDYYQRVVNGACRASASLHLRVGSLTLQNMLLFPFTGIL
jgi:hypothetical protein